MKLGYACTYMAYRILLASPRSRSSPQNTDSSWQVVIHNSTQLRRIKSNLSAYEICKLRLFPIWIFYVGWLCSWKWRTLMGGGCWNQLPNKCLAQAIICFTHQLGCQVFSYVQCPNHLFLMHSIPHALCKSPTAKGQTLSSFIPYVSLDLPANIILLW